MMRPSNSATAPVMAAEPSSWGTQWPQPSAVAARFYAAARSGCTTPETVVAEVAADFQRRLEWTVRTDQRAWMIEVLRSLRTDPEGAEQYAAEVLRREREPGDVKAARRHAQEKAAMLAAMKGKTATAKQRWILETHGYTGPPPQDRAEASVLIDQLLQPGGAMARGSGSTQISHSAAGAQEEIARLRTTVAQLEEELAASVRRNTQLLHVNDVAEKIIMEKIDDLCRTRRELEEVRKELSSTGTTTNLDAVYKGLLVLCHPDKWQGQGAEVLAHELTVHLNALRAGKGGRS